jgi:hypothetical protein
MQDHDNSKIKLENSIKSDEMIIEEYIINLENISAKISKIHNNILIRNHIKKDKIILDNSTLSIINKTHELLKTMNRHYNIVLNLVNDFDIFQEEEYKDYHSISDGIIETRINRFENRSNSINSDCNSETYKQDKKKIQEKKIPKSNNKQINKQPYKTLTYLHSINYSLKIQNIDNINDIPESIYYFKGNEKFPAGLYIKLLDGNLCRIPFPKIIDSKKDFNRKNTIKCKYETIDECIYQKKSWNKICNFGHKGEEIIKIGYPARCPNFPSFGNPNSIKNDIVNIEKSDIENLLLYGLNDIACAMIALNYNNVNDSNFINLDTN